MSSNWQCLDSLGPSHSIHLENNIVRNYQRRRDFIFTRGTYQYIHSWKTKIVFECTSCDKAFSIYLALKLSWMKTKWSNFQFLREKIRNSLKKPHRRFHAAFWVGMCCLLHSILILVVNLLTGKGLRFLTYRYSAANECLKVRYGLLKWEWNISYE